MLGLESVFGVGLLLSALFFGFRHGIDWDHIAAITDISGSQESRHDAVVFGTLYALGHAFVVLMVGSAAILLGMHLPPGVDLVMERVVGATLILLGVYVFVSIARQGRDFRLRSRWMLVFAGARKLYRRVRHDHSHAHSHDTFANYGRASSFAVGMLHGVGAETPTQLVIFITAAGAGGRVAGEAVLGAFLVGLLISNTMLTLGSATGFLKAAEHGRTYLAVATMVASFSLVVGTLFLTGRSLPTIFG